MRAGEGAARCRTTKDLEVDGLAEPRGELLVAGTRHERADEDAEVITCGERQQGSQLGGGAQV